MRLSNCRQKAERIYYIGILIFNLYDFTSPVVLLRGDLITMRISCVAISKFFHNVNKIQDKLRWLFRIHNAIWNSIIPFTWDCNE